MQTGTTDFEQVTAGLKTKSDKIRALSRHGVPTAEIARYLGIRYQHARNVLKEAGLHRAANEGPAVKAVDERPAYAWVRLGDDGTLNIPAALLAAAGVAPGRDVHVRLTSDGIEILSQEAALRRAQVLLAPYKRPGVSEVDEFIAERRREAAREDHGQ